MAFKYIALHYIRYFLIILSALVLFLVGFDYLGSSEKLDISANLLLIYVVYKSFYAIDLLLPLSLVFAMIATKISLIRSNALVSFYSLGYSQKDILKPFIVVSGAAILIFIAVHGISNFARADEFAKNIRKNAQYLNPSRDLFFTYGDKFVYFSEMLPLQESAKNIRVFTLKNGSLREVLVAKMAHYKDNSWFIESADIIAKPNELDFNSTGIKVTEQNKLAILEGFRPKMLDQIYEGKVNFTIGDAMDAYFLLKSQKINTDIVRSSIYKIFIHPFFAPLLIIVIFFLVPISARFLNISLFGFTAISSSLGVWAILFMLIELSNHKTLPSEVAILAPTIMLLFAALWQYRRYHRFE